jgi:hypothetical protein
VLKLRKFLCGCFGGFALLFLFVSFGTLPFLLNISKEFAFDDTLPTTTPFEKIIFFFAAALVSLILLSPLLVTFLNGMAWWTIKQKKASARGWAIAASLTLIVSGILTSLPEFYSRSYNETRFFRNLLVISGVIMALGIAGLVAFGRRDSMAQPVIAVKPPRIAGDGTSRLLEILALLVGIIGVYNGITWWLRWGSAKGLHVDYGILYFIQIVAAFLITTTFHEFGHATIGRALGMKLCAFVVGPFQWRIRDGRWKFQFLPAKLFSAGGATGLVPTNPGQSRWNDIGMIAAGPLASLLIGLTALAAALTAKGQPYEQYWELFALVSTFALVGFAINLIPVQPEALYSDGARIYQLLRGGPWADLRHAFNVSGSTMVTPLRPKDFDIELIQRASRSITQGHQALVLRLIASSYYLDRGLIPQACDAVTEAESIYHNSALDLPAELCMSFVYRTAILRRDAAGARQWWERMKAKKPTHFGVDYWLAQSALFWIEGRKEEARVAWNKGNVLAQQLPAAGDYEFDRYRSTLLHDCIENAESNAASN